MTVRRLVYHKKIAPIMQPSLLTI